LKRQKLGNNSQKAAAIDEHNRLLAYRMWLEDRGVLSSFFPQERSSSHGMDRRSSSGSESLRFNKSENKVSINLKSSWSGTKGAECLFVGDFSGEFAVESPEMLQMFHRIVAALKIQTFQTLAVNSDVLSPIANNDDFTKQKNLEEFLALIKNSGAKKCLIFGWPLMRWFLKRDNLEMSTHGSWFQDTLIPVMWTFHFRDMLQRPILKKPVWEDLQRFVVNQKA